MEPFIMMMVIIFSALIAIALVFASVIIATEKSSRYFEKEAKMLYKEMDLLKKSLDCADITKRIERLEKETEYHDKNILRLWNLRFWESGFKKVDK